MRNVDLLVLVSVLGLLAYALVGCGRQPPERGSLEQMGTMRAVNAGTCAAVVEL